MALLRQHHDPASQRLECRLAEIDAAERDLAPLRVVLAREQLCQRRLAGAGRADQRHVLSRLQLERHAVDDRPLTVVAERDVVQCERSASRELDGSGAFHDCVRRLQQPHDLSERGQALAELAEPLAEAGDRVEQLHQVEDVSGDRPSRDRPMAIHRRRDEQDREQCHRLRERDHREEADVHE